MRAVRVVMSRNILILFGNARALGVDRRAS
jgi:hypothetical protein